MARFEIVSRFSDAGLAIPERKTQGAAGYDMAAAEDIIIQPYSTLMPTLFQTWCPNGIYQVSDYVTLKEMANLTKQSGVKPTLVSTGMKCQLDAGTYLELVIRSSSPLKYWLTLANNVGVIDADYYNNPDNEGEIFFQIINLSPIPIKIQKGEIIGQGIIKPYLLTEDDAAAGVRTGGFGSTTK